MSENIRIQDNDLILAWAHITAYAWKHPEFLANLRINPKETIDNIAQGNDPTAIQAGKIRQSAVNPVESYSGYLPIPDPFGGIEKLTKEELAAFLIKGVTGILRFDRESDLWADALHQAWQDWKKSEDKSKSLLINIRKDPLQYLPNADKLKKKTYGIFPLPDLPRGLRKLEMKELGDFLSDQENAPHLAGIIHTVP